MTFEIGVAAKESSANLPFVEIGWRGNVRADGDLNKRRIYDLSELFCAPQVRYMPIAVPCRWCMYKMFIIEDTIVHG